MKKTNPLFNSRVSMVLDFNLDGRHHTEEATHAMQLISVSGVQEKFPAMTVGIDEKMPAVLQQLFGAIVVGWRSAVMEHADHHPLTDDEQAIAVPKDEHE